MGRTKFRTLLATHRKFIVGVVGAALTALTAALGPDNPWVLVAIAAATALGVEQVPNAEKPAGDAGAVQPDDRRARGGDPRRHRPADQVHDRDGGLNNRQ